jgi:proteic killer suppression protein
VALARQGDPLDVLRGACYSESMIRSYRDKDTESLADNRYVKAFDSIQVAARKKLDILKAAKSLAELAVIPGNRLEALSGNRQGQHSIRINDQYRICFVVEGDEFKDVEITDYH